MGPGEEGVGRERADGAPKDRGRSPTRGALDGYRGAQGKEYF
jgi:hypothetical protein